MASDTRPEQPQNDNGEESGASAQVVPDQCVNAEGPPLADLAEAGVSMSDDGASISDVGTAQSGREQRDAEGTVEAVAVSLAGPIVDRGHNGGETVAGANSSTRAASQPLPDGSNNNAWMEEVVTEQLDGADKPPPGHAEPPPGPSEGNGAGNQRHSHGSDTIHREHSAPSSFYGGRSASLVGGAGGSIAAATVDSTINGSTLSPQYTLVNSDGASLRVHTGSIRERYMQQHISAIHEDDSDVYSESRRSDSLLFAYEVQSTSSRYYAGQPGSGRTFGNSNPPSARHPHPDDTPVTSAAAAAAATAAAAAAVAASAGNALSVGVESDGMSVFSVLSDGGASTTRMRMATDRAYNALRIGPQAAAAASLLSYYSGAGGAGNGGGLQRVTSFATSSDPGGLPGAGSFYDVYYVDADGYVPYSDFRACVNANDSPRHSEAASDSRSGRSNWKDDLGSVIHSDVAVYNGAAEDVKFPFLYDNISEFSGPYMCSSAGAMGAIDAERPSRDYSDIVYYPSSPQYRAHSPQYPDTQSPPQQQQPHPIQHRSVFGQRWNEQSSQDPGNDGKKIKKKKKKDKEPRLLARNAGGKQRAGSSAAEYATASAPPEATARASTPPHGVRHWMAPLATVGPNSTTNPWGRSNHRYRHQSAGETTYQSAAVVAAVAAANARQPPIPLTGANDHDAQVAIRPNAIMRFLKRIAPKN